MTQTDNSALDNHSASPAVRLAWVLLILATLYLCYFHNLGAIGFVGPDEPRYAWIARDMVESGDWVTPRLYGKPWFEKPVLYYWGAALSFKLFGVSEAAARFPSALAALFATLAMAWFAWRVYGAETARWLLLLLPTTVGMIGFSHAAATDMPFAGMLTIAMVFAARLLGVFPRSLSSTSFISSTSFTSFLFGFFLGLAVLAKGPAAIILSGGAVLLWAAFTNRWRDAFRCLHPVAIVSFCLTALPWYILCARRNPDFFRIFIIEHNFKRYLTPEFQHIQPFWFYAPVLLVCFLPWIFAFAWTILLGSRTTGSSSSEAHSSRFLISWSLFCFVFFSISKSKLPGYILPCIPALGLLLSHQFTRRPKSANLLGISYGAFSILLYVAAVLVGRVSFPDDINHMPQMLTRTLVAEVLLVFCASNLLIAGGCFFWNNAVFRQTLFWLAVVTVLGALVAWPKYVNKFALGIVSPKLMAEGLHNRGVPADRIFALKNANRSWRYGASYYLHSEITDWNPEDRHEAFVLTGTVTCPQLNVTGYTWRSIEINEQGGLWFVCRMTPQNSPGGLAGGGNDGGGSGNGGTDRQPR